MTKEAWLKQALWSDMTINISTMFIESVAPKLVSVMEGGMQIYSSLIDWPEFIIPSEKHLLYVSARQVSLKSSYLHKYTLVDKTVLAEII